jgi:hypothetical protein
LLVDHDRFYVAPGEVTEPVPALYCVRAVTPGSQRGLHDLDLLSEALAYWPGCATRSPPGPTLTVPAPGRGSADGRGRAGRGRARAQGYRARRRNRTVVTAIEWL